MYDFIIKCKNILVGSYNIKEVDNTLCHDFTNEQSLLISEY